jgi:DNA-binding beta-propeller fold protein YncE
VFCDPFGWIVSLNVTVKASINRWVICVVVFGLMEFHSLADFTATNFFNWETSPVHPVEISPDATKLVVCNLPDNRLEIFDIGTGKPHTVGSVPVGLDPVTVRFRTASEVWVANYISDSISIIDLPSMRVVSTITTSNEPSDIVFAGSPERAFVSCAQPALVQVFNVATRQWVTNFVIQGNRPRAMASSADGRLVYVAIFESGNASTIIGTGISSGFPRPSPINFPNAPSNGKNPPPNAGTNFSPALNPRITNTTPPRVSLIVKRNSAGRWMDDNQGDWTEFIRGTNAAFTGRVPGWDLADRDLAVINTVANVVSYAGGLMNICMSLAVNPASGKVAVIGTDAINDVRFQPNLNGIFVRVELALVDPRVAVYSQSPVTDLNPHLNYRTNQIPQTQREQSIGDPRAIIWNGIGTVAYVAGMGSDNVITMDETGSRIAPPIGTGAGPAGLALDESRGRLYVYNRFDGSISTIDTAAQSVIDTYSLFDPTPPGIKAGRPHFYNTHETSGLGQAACASCHVDGRFDRLAWDLGDPKDVIGVIGRDINFGNNVPGVTNQFHPMKGPMVTLTLQDIIGHEPFHWRGDRADIEAFDSTFTNLQGAVTGLATNEMQDFKSFLATIRFAPNPYRQFDNSLSTNVPLPDQFALGRGTLPAGARLPNGNAVSGQLAFRTNSSNGCIPCHTLPAGLGTDMHFNSVQWTPIAVGTNSGHHIASIELERSSGLPFKIPSLRNAFDKVGMNLTGSGGRAGFGFSHDGSVDNLVRFAQDAFDVTNDQTISDLTAFLFSLTGSDLTPGSLTDVDRSPGVASLDTAAAVGRQITIRTNAPAALIDAMLALAGSSTSRVDLVVKGVKGGLPRGWFFDSTSGNFLSDRKSEVYLPDALRALAAPGAEQTYTVVPRGCGRRIGIDRDADGYLDRDELDFGSDPANPLSLATNTPPVLLGPSNVLAIQGWPLILPFTATDRDIPAQSLTFTLGAGAPSGCSINPTNGVFAWLVPANGPVQTNAITAIVTDNGKPPQTNAITFKVVAIETIAVSLTLARNSAALNWNTVPGLAYRLQYKNDLAEAAWTDLPEVVATATNLSAIDAGRATNKTRFYRISARP